MKYIPRQPVALAALLGLFVLSGCAATRINDSSLQKRTVSFSIGLDGIRYEKTTEGLAIGEAELIEKAEEE
jgi:hypothetical protein